MLGEWGGCLLSPAPHPPGLRAIDAKWPAPWSGQSPSGPWGVRGALVTTSSRGWVAVIHPLSPGAHSLSFPPPPHRGLLHSLWDSRPLFWDSRAESGRQ